MPTCASCGVLACRRGEREDLPANCPMREDELMWEAFAAYREPDNHRFFLVAAELEAAGYEIWPRLRETAEFCRRMGYRRVGVAFCAGLRREAAVVTALLRRYGLEVASVICKAGGIGKQEVGIPEEHFIRPGTFEAMCNPIAQARLLNREGCEFNIVIGLCVGHDSLFYKYSDAPVTTLIAKDRVLGNNPAGAVYCSEGYLKRRLEPEGDVPETAGGK